MIVREYIPGFVDRDEPPREASIAAVIEALSIPWLKDKGELTIKDNRVMVGELVVATIYPDDSTLWERIGGEILNRAFRNDMGEEEFRRQYLCDWPVEQPKDK